MATRAPFVNTKFSGYYHRDVPKENEELTHIGAGTPCGEYLRRFWHPVAYSDELTDLPKKDEKTAKRPERVAQQLMLSCL